jgi:hypothetical protein
MTLDQELTAEAAGLPPVDFSTDEEGVTTDFPWQENERELLLTTLRMLGGTHIMATYSGSGDSGEIDLVSVIAADGTTLDTDALTMKAPLDHQTYDDDKKAWVTHFTIEEQPITKVIENLLWRMIEHFDHSGWENNDGGSGSLEVDLETQPIEFKYVHSDNVTTTEDHFHPFR